MSARRIYPGIDKDHYGGMSDVGKIIRDAWVFGLLPETETCAGWDYGALESLYDKVHAAWNEHGHLVSRLPPELRERHARIYEAAVQRAKELGWDADLSAEDND